MLNGITFTSNVVHTDDPLMPSTAGLLTLEMLKEQKNNVKQEIEEKPKEIEEVKKEPAVSKASLVEVSNIICVCMFRFAF